MKKTKKRYEIECPYYPPYNLNKNYQIRCTGETFGGIPFFHTIYEGTQEECKRELKRIKESKEVK